MENVSWRIEKSLIIREARSFLKPGSGIWQGSNVIKAVIIED